MVKLDPTFSAVAAAAVAAIATSVMLNQLAPRLTADTQVMAGGNAYAAGETKPPPVWAASATGRVEPKDGEVRIATEVPGRIVEVSATTNDKVQAGDVLVTLDGGDLAQKFIAAQSEALVRVLERDEEAADSSALCRTAASSQDLSSQPAPSGA